VVREALPPVVGHQEQILEAHATVALTVHARLDGDLAGDEALAAARTGAFVRGASDRSLRTVKVVDAPTANAGSG
jgi:hypothetical protein